MRKARPELFSGADKVDYPVVNMGFVDLQPDLPAPGLPLHVQRLQNKFICPCHGSQYSELGAHEAGPAPRGLDPLPLASSKAEVEVTWIEYNPNTPDHIVIVSQGRDKRRLPRHVHLARPAHRHRHA